MSENRDRYRTRRRFLSINSSLCFGEIYSFLDTIVPYTIEHSEKHGLPLISMDERKHSLTDEEHIHSAKIKLVEVWQGSKTIKGRMLACVKLQCTQHVSF